MDSIITKRDKNYLNIDKQHNLASGSCSTFGGFGTGGLTMPAFGKGGKARFSVIAVGF